MHSEDIIEELNDLIQLDFDASRTYEQALDHVDDADVRADLEAFQADHLRHITNLRAGIEDLGGAPIEPGPEVKGVLLEGMIKLRSVTGTLGALKAMRMNEKLTNLTYDKAIELDLPGRVLEVVTANQADERRHLAAIEAHIARLQEAEEAKELEARDESYPEVYI